MTMCPDSQWENLQVEDPDPQLLTPLSVGWGISSSELPWKLAEVTQG